MDNLELLNYFLFEKREMNGLKKNEFYPSALICLVCLISIVYCNDLNCSIQMNVWICWVDCPSFFPITALFSVRFYFSCSI